jgi:hypothetical protein
MCLTGKNLPGKSLAVIIMALKINPVELANIKHIIERIGTSLNKSEQV